VSKPTGRGYSGTPCDLCGGETFSFPSGSIWCAAEDPHAGGHFVKRVAFERPPARVVDRTGWATQPPKRTAPTAPAPRRSSTPTSKPVKVEPKDDGMNVGYDAFVRSDDK
jgi:hypothetical protein